jgi:hypothetical protein
MRQRWPLLVAFVVAVLGVAVACGYFMPNDFMKGLVVGAAMVAGTGGVWLLTVQVTGTAPVMMGDQAEQWTAQELRKSARKGWRLVNHLALGVDDIDHVLIGPGGAYAIETKWNGSSWRSDYGVARQRDAVSQARANARTLALWHHFKSRQIPVHPVVVLWGQGISRWPEEEHIRSIDGVRVVIGPALRSWREHLASDALDEEQIDAGWAGMADHAARRDPIDAAKHPLPTSLAEWAVRGSLAVTTAATALVIFGSVLNRTQSVVLTVAVAVALGLAGAIAVRVPSPRWVLWPAWAWVASWAGASGATVLAEVAYRL